MMLKSTDTAVNSAALEFRAAASRRTGNSRIMSPDEGAGSVFCPGILTAADRHHKYADTAPASMLAADASWCNTFPILPYSEY